MQILSTMWLALVRTSVDKTVIKVQNTDSVCLVTAAPSRTQKLHASFRPTYYKDSDRSVVSICRLSFDVGWFFTINNGIRELVSTNRASIAKLQNRHVSEMRTSQKGRIYLSHVLVAASRNDVCHTGGRNGSSPWSRVVPNSWSLITTF